MLLLESSGASQREGVGHLLLALRDSVAEEEGEAGHRELVELLEAALERAGDEGAGLEQAGAEGEGAWPSGLAEVCVWAVGSSLFLLSSISHLSPFPLSLPLS